MATLSELNSLEEIKLYTKFKIRRGRSVGLIEFYKYMSEQWQKEEADSRSIIQIVK